MEVHGHLHALAALPLRKELVMTYGTGSWTDPRASLDTMERSLFLLPGIKFPYFSHPEWRLVTIPTQLS
jgi:hypothetical protein